MACNTVTVEITDTMGSATVEITDVMGSVTVEITDCQLVPTPLTADNTTHTVDSTDITADQTIN